MTKNIRKNYKGYATREGSICYKRECFVPFTGNGMKICRLYELGRCPDKYISK